MPSITRPFVAFIIVGWNNESILSECIESLLNQSYPHTKVIFIDNNSRDNSVELVRTQFPNVQIVKNERNAGFAKANNQGIKLALEDPKVGMIALINTDARIDKNWTEKIVNFSAQKPSGAFFQGTTLDYYDHNIIDSTHIYISLNGQGTQGNWRHHHSKEVGPKKIFGTNAAACMISRNFLEEQPFKKLFDEKLFMYLEDVDVAVRATVTGWDNYLVPGARAYHMGSASSGKNPGFSLYMTFRNNSGVLFKNYSFKLLFRIWPKLVRGDIDTIRTLWRRDQKSAIMKVINGRLIGIVRLPLFIGDRWVVRRHARIYDEYLWDLMRKGY